MSSVSNGDRGGDFARVLSDAALAASDMATYGIGSAFGPGAYAESFGRPSDAFDRLGHAVALATAAASETLLAGGRATGPDAGHGGGALPAAGHAAFVTSSAVAAARGVAARSLPSVADALARSRAAMEPVGRFLSGSTVTMVGSGAPDAVGSLARRAAMLGMAAGVAMTVAVPGEAKAWGPNNGQRGGVPVRMAFRPPVPMQRFQAPPVQVPVQRAAPAWAGNGTGGGWNGNGGGNGGWTGNGGGWNGNGNGWNGNGNGWGGRPRLGAAVAGFVAGAALGSALGGQGVQQYPSQAYPTTSYPAYGGQGYAPSYGGQGAYQGGTATGLAPLPPSDHIVAAAKLMVALDTGSYRGASAQVENAVRLGMACARQAGRPCIVGRNEFHFDFREGVYGVKRNGVDVAVETSVGYRALAPQLIREASARVRVMRDEEAALGSDGPGPYGDRGVSGGPAFGR